MNRASLAVLPLAVAVVGCGASVDQFSRAADSARTATEQMAVASNNASNARENKILQDARDLAATQAAQAGLDTGERPRYEIRKDQDGWTVYDTANNSPARVGPKPQAGLSRADAERAFASLNADEKRIQQQFAPGGPLVETP
jgi:primase-polymerase (primpol)-like protein